MKTEQVLNNIGNAARRLAIIGVAIVAAPILVCYLAARGIAKRYRVRRNRAAREQHAFLP